MLMAVESERLAQPVQVLDSSGEPVVVRVAEWSPAAPALVVVHELELVRPRVQGSHVGAPESGGAVEHDERGALADDGARDLDVSDGNGFTGDVHDGLLECVDLRQVRCGDRKP